MIPAGGYAWWYVDALSADGQFGLTIIAFIGSVFSPYYAWSGWADPLDHCAFNVALYGARDKKWAMTERRRAQVRQDEHTLAIGPSSITWANDALTLCFDEITAPAPSRLRGTVCVRPLALANERFALDEAGRHVWRPIAPRAEVEVTVRDPACTWRGEGYFDTNCGSEPLERGFASWDWSRAHLSRDTLLFYDVERLGGERAHFAARVNRAGEISEFEPPPSNTLSPTFWRMGRAVRAEAPTLHRTLEDAPFYARSALAGSLSGERAQIVHESLSLSRLRSPIVRAMLPFRMPRAFW